MTAPDKTLLRTSGSYHAHARLLNAQRIVPDKDGVWTVTFQPNFPLQEHDFRRMAEFIRATPGVQIVQDTLALAFRLDCTGAYNPERALERVSALLRVARRDHIIATQRLDEANQQATVTLLFRQRRTDGELLDIANSAAAMNGVEAAKPTGDNEVILDLNAHYATVHGVEVIVAAVANMTGAHVLDIVTQEVSMPFGATPSMAVPSVSPPFSSMATRATPPHLPSFAGNRTASRRQRRTVLLARGYRTYITER